MSVFRNRSGCNCCPRQTNLYKESKRKIGKLNYSDDWASSKIPDYPYIHEEIEADKHAYEVCCKTRERRVRAHGKEYLTLSEYEGLEKSKSLLGDPNDRLLKIYGSPLAQRISIVNKKPKWREEREERLQEEAKAEKEKYIVTSWQNVVKKQEAQDKFHRLQKQNQKKNFRWRLEKEQVLRQSEKDLYGNENAKQKKEKSTPEQIEKDLMKTFSKIGIIRKYRTKVDTIPPNVVLNTPLGKYLKNSHKSQNKKRKAQKSTFDQTLKDKATKVPKFYSLRESQPFLVKIPTNKTTHVGAKFSWNFRKLVKVKAVPKPKMSKPFDKLIKGRNVEIPELMPALKSRDKILTERDLKEEEKKMVDKPVKSSFKSHKSRQRDESEPNYGVHAIDKSTYLPLGEIKPKISEQFHKMLRGKERNIPELNETLMSHHEILPDMRGAGKVSSGPQKSRLKTESEPNYGVSKNKKARDTPSGDIKPKISQQFHKMLRGKEKNIPELNEALMSHHEILPDMRRPESNLKSKFHQGLKKFDHYIRGSVPDWRIVRRRGSKGTIPYLNRKSIASVISEKSDRIGSREIAEKAEKTARSSGFIIRTAEIDQSFLPVREKEVEDVERWDKTSDIMSDPIPEDYQPHHKQDPSLKNALIEIMENISKPKNWVKPESRSSSEQKVRRSSSASLKSISDDFKKLEHQTLEEHAEREQYQKELVLEDKAVVQARIQELMKFVVIREDFQPPKPPRNFIRENIEMLQKMRPRKIAQVKKRGKPNKKYPISMEKNKLPESPDCCESLCRYPNQQLSDKEYGPTKELCCSSHDQQGQYQAEPKAPAEAVDKEDSKCGIFDVLRSGYSKPDSDFTQKTQAQRLLRRKRGNEAWNLEKNKEKLCRKHC